MNNGYWIWYAGDFEIFHGLRQDLSREERGFFWPAWWYIYDCRKNVKFYKRYDLSEPTTFSVYSNGRGYININGKKRSFKNPITCDAGILELEVFVGNENGIPAILIEGETIYTDDSWMVYDYAEDPVRAGCCPRYTEKNQDPSVWQYETTEYKPVIAIEKNGGVLFDFKQELTAILHISFQDKFKPILICYGESEAEALDTKMCYYSQYLESENEEILKRAFRCIFIPGISANDVQLTATHYYVDIPVISKFQCEDKTLNKIWETAVTTFQLCSGIFFLDGVKRDKWIWSGDAYQDYFINQYLMFDEEINKRTIWVLRGNDPIYRHINNFIDYSLLWIISIYNHYQMTADISFVKAIYPKMSSMMAFLNRQIDERGFIVEDDRGIVFIDWADTDKIGPACVEQILLAMCYKTMHKVAELLGETETEYTEKYENLLQQIEKYYWDSEKHAYIDGFISGERRVTRHTNIIAAVFGISDAKRTNEIIKYVIENKNIPAITTPYFKFFELEVLCMAGKYGQVLDEIKNYWGGMLKDGAVSFWEQYTPGEDKAKHYEMYGDPYGKSMCHAWSASPIYLIGKYFMGIEPTSPGYETFQVMPQISLMKQCKCTFPLKSGVVSIKWDDSRIEVATDKEGGTFIYRNKKFNLKKNEKLIISTCC